jgi:excisionase family DNA binding protein
VDEWREPNLREVNMENAIESEKIQFEETDSEVGPIGSRNDPWPPPLPRLFSAQDLAVFLGLGYRTVRDLAQAGALPVYRIGRQMRFDPLAVLEATRQLPSGRRQDNAARAAARRAKRSEQGAEGA